MAQTPSLLPLEVDDAVHLLVAAAAEAASVMTPWLLRPPFFGLRLQQRLLRLFFLRSVQLGEVADRARRGGPADVGLY